MSTPETEQPSPDNVFSDSTGTAQLGKTQQRSTGHYVFVLIVILLMVETTTYGATAFIQVLPHMVPPFTPAQLPWIFSITLLVAASVQPLMGKLADVFGRKRMLMAVAVIFMLGSLLGALSTSFTLVMIARVLQASAVALPGVTYSFFREYMPPKIVPVAVGLGSTTTGLALLVSPMLAGALLSLGDFRMVFWFCFFYMLIFGTLAGFVVPNTRRSGGKRPRLREIDLRGSLLLTLGAGALLLGITLGGSEGWGSVWTVLSLVGSVVMFVLFVVAEQRAREPMIPLSLLRGPALGRSLIVGLFAQVPGTWTYLVSQMLETKPTPGAGYAFGLSATEVGVVILGFGIMNIIFGPLGGYLARRTSPRTVMLVSLTAGVASSFLTAFMHDQKWQFVIFGVIGGVASGCYYGGLNNLIIEAVPERLTGVATGMGACVSAFMGSAVPVIAGVILAGHVLTTGHGGAPTYTSHGYTIVFVIMGIAALVGLVLTLGMRHGRAHATGGVAVH
ncbi:MAG TPA: MFS transporter [Amycolatopsis sp.]|nr:MFS transporter [Amycolatopsis sp.]